MLLWGKSGKSESGFDEISKIGRSEGWLEGEDVLFNEGFLEKRNAARIVNGFLRKVLFEEDINEYGECQKLKDLYDCHVCTDHIAAVFDKGIIDSRTDTVFGITDKVTYSEAEAVVARVFDKSQRIRGK